MCNHRFTIQICCKSHLLCFVFSDLLFCWLIFSTHGNQSFVIPYTLELCLVFVFVLNLCAGWSIYSLDWQSCQTFVILKWVIYIGLFLLFFMVLLFFWIIVMGVVGLNSDLGGIIAIGMQFVFGYQWKEKEGKNIGLENLTLELILIIWCGGMCLRPKATHCKFKSGNQSLQKNWGLRLPTMTFPFPDPAKVGLLCTCATFYIEQW